MEATFAATHALLFPPTWTWSACPRRTQSTPLRVRDKSTRPPAQRRRRVVVVLRGLWPLAPASAISAAHHLIATRGAGPELHTPGSTQSPPLRQPTRARLAMQWRGMSPTLAVQTLAPPPVWMATALVMTVPTMCLSHSSSSSSSLCRPQRAAASTASTTSTASTIGLGLGLGLGGFEGGASSSEEVAACQTSQLSWRGFASTLRLPRQAHMPMTLGL